MDPISLNCAKCKQALKFPAARAGKKAKCTRCGADLTVPDGSPPPPPPPAGIDDDDEGPKTYTLVEVEQEKKKAPVEANKKDKSKSAIERRKKTIKDADAWSVVRHGFTLMKIGTMIWLGCYGAYLLVLLLGATAGPEFNVLRMKVLVGDDAAVPGADNLGDLDLARFGVALIAGENWLSLAMTIQILVALGTLVQIAFFMMGYFTCLVVPPRFGARSQVKAMITMGIVNGTIVVLFKLLALLGIFYVVLPYLVPELPMLESNIERMVPIHLTWSHIPILDVFLTLLFICCQWAEPIIGAKLLHSVGLSLKDEQIKEEGATLVQMAMGVAFVTICYQLISLNGASDVIVNTMRLVYLLMASLQVYFILRFMSLLGLAHATINGLLEDYVPPESDDDDDDADDEPRPKKRKKKRVEEDEDDDDDDDDQDERRPRKRKKR
jgi:hypothetical protein